MPWHVFRWPVKPVATWRQVDVVKVVPERSRSLDCRTGRPYSTEKGLLFVGLDVIGDYLTEINVTSPTCIRELDDQFNLDIGMELMNCIEKELAQR